MKIKIILILLCLLSFSLYAQPTNTLTRPGLFDNIFSNTWQSFTGWNSFFHLSGIGLTYLIIDHDIDYKVSTYFHNNARVAYWFYPVAMTGTLAPLTISACFYFSGKSQNNYRKMAAGCAVLQANIITFFYISALKFFTGRPNPDYEDHEGTDHIHNLSRTFRFGLGRGGIIWGWPSGHTGATITTVAALTAYYPDSIWLKIGGYFYSIYTLIGVCAVGEGTMHWFSDAVAAWLMGFTIGRTVGHYYRNRYNQPEKNKKTSGLFLSPVYRSANKGIAINLQF